MTFSYYEAFITSFVVGLAENYFAAYSIQIGLSALQSGLLISLPLVFAALFHFIVQPYFKYLGVSTFVKTATIIQSISLMGLSVITLLSQKPGFFILFALYSIYWLGHFAIQPAWNRWISEIVPFDLGQNFFSVRARLNQIGIIVGLIIGGLTLHLNIIEISTDYLFFGLFTVSFFCKIAAYFLFKKHHILTTSIYVSRTKMLSILKKYLSFFKSYGLFNFSVYLSAPFVAGYLLKERELNYFEFMLVMLGLFIGKVITSIALNNTKKQIDPTLLMFVGGLVAGPLPILWPLSTAVWMMFLTHLISGIAWASWEVGLSLCFFKNIDTSEKMETISVYNYIGVATQVAGTCAGALLVQSIFSVNYTYLFIFAGIIRFLCVLPLKKNRLAMTSKV